VSLETQIGLMTVPQEFARLCTALLVAEHGDDFLPIDDDQPDAGNDGYLPAEKRMVAMHCFKRVQNQGLDNLIRRKMVGDLGKAIALKRADAWEIDAWTFISNYPVSERLASELVAIGNDAGIRVSWVGPAELALTLQSHPNVHARFPQLQVNDISARLGAIQDGVVGLARDLKPAPIDLSGIPRTPEQQASLIAARPACWEYLLFAGALVQGEEALEFDFLDHKLRIAPEREALDFHTTLGTIRSTFSRASGFVEPIDRAFTRDAQEHAFGRLGEHGDVLAIQHLARIVIDTYGSFLQAAEQLRSIDPPQLLRQALSLALQFLDAPLASIRDFISRTVEEVDRLPEHLERGEPVTVEIALVLDVDQEVLRQYRAEMERIERKIRWRKWSGLDPDRR